MDLFLRLIGCYEENVLENVDNCEYTLHRPVISKTKRFGLSSSSFYRGWLKAIETGNPVIITPRRESERIVLQGEVESFNTRVKDLILTSDLHMDNVPLVAEVTKMPCSIFAIVAPRYFKKEESDRYDDLENLSHIII